MEITTKLDDGKLTLTVSGRLDTNSAPELEAAMVFDGAREVVFDFAGLEYISSAGLRLLLTAKKTTAAAGQRMSVVNSNATVRSVFEMTGCGEIFGIV